MIEFDAGYLQAIGLAGNFLKVRLYINMVAGLETLAAVRLPLDKLIRG